MLHGFASSVLQSTAQALLCIFDYAHAHRPKRFIRMKQYCSKRPHIHCLAPVVLAIYRIISETILSVPGASGIRQSKSPVLLI